MNKPDFIKAVQAASDGRLTKSTIEEFITAQATAAAKTLEAGVDFAIPGVVSIKVASQAARVGRNPRTGESVHIPAKRVAKAKPAHNLREF